MWPGKTSSSMYFLLIYIKDVNTKKTYFIPIDFECDVDETDLANFANTFGTNTG